MAQCSSRKGKLVLLASLASWILFTLPVGFIQPPATSCIIGHNASSFELTVPQEYSPRFKHKRSVETEPLDFAAPIDEPNADPSQPLNRIRRRAPPIYEAGISPVDVSYADNFDKKKHRNWVSPLFSSIVYTYDDINKAFFLLFLLIVIGEFFSAPSITLADSAVITLLGDNADKYGHQRMFGSLGWGLSMFFVGIALDHSTAFPNHPCGPEKQEKNYSICFATFSVLMGAAWITATQINFKYGETVDAVDGDVEQNADPKPTYEDELQNQLAEQLQLPSLAAGPREALPPQPPLGGQSKMFAQTSREIPEWVTVISSFKDLKCASFLFVAFFMGFGIGLIFTFLFWHLQDYGGSSTLFGVASVINHISEIFAYFFSFRLITQIGHVKVSAVMLCASGPACAGCYLFARFAFRFVVGVVSGLDRQHLAIPVHLLLDEPVVRAAFRIYARHHARGRMGGLLLIHCPQHTASLAFVGSGCSAGTASR